MLMASVFNRIDIVNIYLVLFIFVAVYKCECAKQGEFSRVVLGKDQAKSLRAIACIGVILHLSSFSFLDMG